MTSLKTLLGLALLIYVGLVLLLYVTQRSLQYLPERMRTAPAAAGLPQAEEVMLDTADGERVIAWHAPPRDGKPVVLYFHGNGASLRWRTERFRSLIADGTGLLALSYRGYGGSSGSPTEKGLIADGTAAYDFAAERYTPERLALWGESLGSGVAVAIAAEKPVGRVVLESPFSSAADVGAAHYWYVPVRLLMKDQFRSDLLAARITAPVLVMHGDRDQVVPFELGQRLYELIQAPKQFVRFPGLGHNELGANGAVETAQRFLREG
jgi:fermentation-respiration switch protein FrsA (DUF1100 family)